jgi:hypothetical protein
MNADDLVQASCTQVAADEQDNRLVTAIAGDGRRADASAARRRR